MTLRALHPHTTARLARIWLVWWVLATVLPSWSATVTGSRYQELCLTGAGPVLVQVDGAGDVVDPAQHATCPLCTHPCLPLGLAGRILPPGWEGGVLVVQATEPLTRSVRHDGPSSGRGPPLFL